MKIIFGNPLPQRYAFINLDAIFYENLVNAKGDFEKAVDNLVEANLHLDIDFWTCNPLIPNLLADAVAKEVVHIFIEGTLVKFGDDDHLCWKLECMGPGDALADDYRVWPYVPDSGT